MTKKALMIVDTQVNMFDESFSVYGGTRILSVIAKLLEKARESGVDVIFVRNNGSVGEPDETGTSGWHIHPAVSPKDSELIIDKEGANAFLGTNLQTELTKRDIDQIVLAGMQTEMCVAATVKEAIKRGFSVILVKDGHTTFDWDELTALDAIEKHNNELAKFATLQNAQDVNFNGTAQPTDGLSSSI